MTDSFIQPAKRPPPMPPRPSRESLASLVADNPHPLSSEGSPTFAQPRRGGMSHTKASSNPLSSPYSPTSTSSSNAAISVSPLPGPAVSLNISAPTSATPVAAYPSHAHETATSKLQFQTVQAAVQACGIRNDSAGWLLVLAFVNGYMTEPRSTKGKEKERTEYERWERLQRMLEQAQQSNSGMAEFDIVLLLPRDQLGYYQHVGSAFLAAHLLIVASFSTNDVRQAVTLSGLRGYINADDELIFTSCTLGFPFADSEHNMTDPQFQESLIGPSLLKSSGANMQAYPKHKLQRISSLTIPRNPSVKGDKSFEGPPSPVRKTSSSATSRIASLFGGAQANVDRASSSPTNRPSALAKVDETMSIHASSLTVNVAVTDKVLKWSDNIRMIKRGDEIRLRSMLDARLKGAGLTDRIYCNDAVDKAVAFLKVFEPPPPSAINSNDWRLSVKEKDKHKSLGNLYVLANEPDGANLLASAVQELYEIIRSTLVPVPRIELALSEKDAEAEFEDCADSILEIVEDTITDLLYDRLFCIASSSDAADDEALASKNAGLNLLELSLEHLGLDVGDPKSGSEDDKRDSRDVLAIRFGLETLVRDCEKELKTLEDESRRTPKEKLAVLIQTHKIIVDRLSNLPPIPMKADVSKEAETASQSLAAKPRGAEIELVDSFPSSPVSKSPPQSLPITSITGAAPPRADSPSDIVPHLLLPEDQPSTESISQVTSRSVSPLSSPNPALSSSADLILPLLIYCVVRSNPYQLASNLAFIHRFRAESLLGGEASYCLVNMQAVVDFVLNIDKHMESLGLSNERVLSGDSTIVVPTLPESASFPSAVRSKVSQEIGNLAGHVSDGITGVAGVMSLLITRTATMAPGPRTIEDVRNVLSGDKGNASAPRQGFSTGLFRRANASLRNRSQSHLEPLYTSNIPSREEGEVVEHITTAVEGDSSADPPKLSLSNRLASLARFGSTSPNLAKSEGVKTHTSKLVESALPSHSRTSSSATSVTGSVPRSSLEFSHPPIDRFLESSSEDLKLSDVRVLLDDYKRLAAYWQQSQARPEVDG